MDCFKLVAPYAPTGDQPEAIGSWWQVFAVGNVSSIVRMDELNKKRSIVNEKRHS